MRVLVTYLSGTGNAEALAHAIYHSVIHETAKAMLPLAQADEFGDPDVVFVGFPLVEEKVREEVADYLAGLEEGLNVALFLR